MGSERVDFDGVGAKVTRLKHSFDQSLLTLAPTSVVTRIPGVWGGAATPPSRVVVGRTCVPRQSVAKAGRSAVISCGQAKRCSQPELSISRMLSYPLALPNTRQRLGVRCRAQREHRFRVPPIFPCVLELRTPHKAALLAAVQDTDAHIVPGGNVRGSHSVPTLHETGCKPALPL
jgi:hypothetical protein